LDDADANKQAAFIGSIQTGNLLNEAMSGTESAGRDARPHGRRDGPRGDVGGTAEVDGGLRPKINFAQFA